MESYFSADFTNNLTNVVLRDKNDEHFFKLIQLIQTNALVNKRKHIYLYKPDYCFPRTSIFFFPFDLTEEDIQSLKDLNYDVSFHEESEDYWLYGKQRNYYKISWNVEKDKVDGNDLYS